jgi:hypothetical protein
VNIVVALNHLQANGILLNMPGLVLGAVRTALKIWFYRAKAATAINTKRRKVGMT